MLNENELNEIGFRVDNTEGYSSSQLDDLNRELSERVNEIESFTDEWYLVAAWFADEIARR